MSAIVRRVRCSMSDPAAAAASRVRRTALALLTAVSFLLGAACSGVAGYVGMWVSVRANVRVSGAARRSAREALQIALRAGGFSALVVLGMVRAPPRSRVGARQRHG